MIYEDYYSISEINRWSLDHDIPWEDIDRDAAYSQPELLDQIRTSTLIESIHPVTTNLLLRLLWDDVDATAVLSVELFEGFRHFHALRRYLTLLDYEPEVTDEDILDVRRKAIAASADPDLTQELVNFVFSEHFAAYFFTRVARQAADPVLATLAQRIARDEFQHTKISYDLLKKRIDEHQEDPKRVLDAASEFHHYGESAVEEVPVFQRNDLQAIKSYMKKVRQLTGIRLVDHLKEQLLTSTTERSDP
jgi:rubrerythrin